MQLTDFHAMIEIPDKEEDMHRSNVVSSLLGEQR
jgi:hypothetical protein